MDLTCKTNSSKFELFVVMASVISTEIPIEHMFIQSENKIDWNHDVRGDVLVEFLQSLKIGLPDLEQKFFFTDKRFGSYE